MKKILLFAFFAIASAFSYGQGSTVLIRGDTARVYKHLDSSFLKVDSFAIVTGQQIIGRSYYGNWQSSTSLGLYDSTRAIRLNKPYTRRRIGVAVNGMMIYEDSTNTFQCYTNGAWVPCGGSDGIVTADNGLTLNIPTNVQLGSSAFGGGPLLHDTYINTTSAYSLNLFGANTSNLTGNLYSWNNGGGTALYGVSTIASTATPLPAIRAEVLNQQDNTILTALELIRAQSAGADYIGVGVTFKAPTSSLNVNNAGSIMNEMFSRWDTATNSIKTSRFLLTGVFHGTKDTLLDIFGNGATRLRKYGLGNFTGTPTFSLQVDASGNIIEGSAVGGGVSAADLPLRITGGTTVSADTSVAFNPSLVTNLRLQKIIDSLISVNGGSATAPYIPNESWFKTFTSFSTSTANDGMFYGASGTGVVQTTMATNTIVDPLMTGLKTTTGTTAAGRGHIYAYTGGGYAGISINSSYRYTAGFGTMVGALSDGTDTYNLYAGMADDAGALASVVDGVFFRYTHGDSSGNWIFCAWQNSTKTEKQSNVTVAANTLYDLVVTVIGGKAYFYINSVLKDSLSTNIPSGATRATSVVASIQKTVGTTSVDWYAEWGGYGRVNFGFNYFFIALILAAMFTYLEKKKGLLIAVFFTIGVCASSQTYKVYVIRTNTDNTKDSFRVKEFTDSVFNMSNVFVQRTKAYYDQFFNPVYPNSFEGYFLCADNIYRNVSPRSDLSVITNGFNFAADNGANDSYVITLSTIPLAYTNGMMIMFRANTVNTGAATINVNGLGVKNIVKRVNTVLANGDIPALYICILVYNGSDFILINPIVN